MWVYPAAAPSSQGCVMKLGAVVRVVASTEGLDVGDEAVVIGFYRTEEMDDVVVQLRDGSTRVMPVGALEVVRPLSD